MNAQTESPALAALGDFLGHLHLGPRQSYKSLTLWPLLRGPGAPEVATGIQRFMAGSYLDPLPRSFQPKSPSRTKTSLANSITP